MGTDRNVPLDTGPSTLATVNNRSQPAMTGVIFFLTQSLLQTKTDSPGPNTSSTVAEASGKGSTKADIPGGWKWDVTIYDRPGWSTPWIGGPKLIGDEILIQCISHPEDIYYDDWYAEESDTVTLSSIDGGLTWKETSNERFASEPTSSSDDIVVDVSTCSALTNEEDQERKRRLEAAGLGHLYDTTLGSGPSGWLIYPDSMAAELKAKGYSVFDEHPTIPEGQAAVHARAIKGRYSTDRGRTWADADIQGLPIFGHGPVPNGSLELSDGTRLEFFYGCELHEQMRSVYVLRSTDGGANWHTVRIPANPELSLTETSMVAFPSGRVHMMMRCDIGEGYIYSTNSNDGGLTWSAAARTPILGQPLLLLKLRDGGILCTYCHRSFPGGIRACLSHDEGETYDFENEKILRDDVIPGPWISPCGPPSIELGRWHNLHRLHTSKSNSTKAGRNSGRGFVLCPTKVPLLCCRQPLHTRLCPSASR